MLKIKRYPLKIVILGVLAVFITLGTIGFWINSKQDTPATKEQPTKSNLDNVNLAPRTKEDAQRAEDNKQQIIDKAAAASQQTPQAGIKKAVTPTITYAGQYGQVVEVGAYVSGIFEDGGTCKATFTRGSATLTKTVDAIKNVSSMDCPVMSAKSSEFSQKGAWSVIVKYESSTASGVSEARQIEVK